jgi:hypothetical protein
MRAILLICGLLVSTSALAQMNAAPDPATNAAPMMAMPGMSGMTMPANGMADMGMAKVPMCSHTVTDKCMQGGMSHKSVHKKMHARMHKR